MISLVGKRIWIAGHAGMVGSALARRLEGIPGTVLLTARSSELDLRDAAATARWVQRQRPDLVFIAAARVGGILANRDRPVDFLEDNLMIETSVIRASYQANVEKLVFLGSSCIYPRLAPQPIPESALLTGPLEPTNQWYAIAKIAGIMLCDAYRQQYGANFVSAMPTNLYGPNDSYDALSSHVLPAAILKIEEAIRQGSDRVTIWGTGTPLREFMHVDDLADALVFVMEHYDQAGPINIGAGREVTILEVHEIVAKAAGWNGQFVFDASKPDGAPRKLVDSARLLQMGWKPTIPLEEGIRQIYVERN